jgi:hypothetical protein
MNAQINNGGPAFPYDDGPCVKAGMTLRDYFAAKAMQGDIASMRPDQDPASTAKEISERAYFIADAMLAAREVQA